MSHSTPRDALGGGAQQYEYLGRLRGGVKDLVAIGGPTALPPAATALVSARLDRPGVR